MMFSIDLAEAKKIAWGGRIEEIPKSGEIPHGELNALTGRLSFSQASVFGRFGRAMMQPIYRKLYTGFYTAQLSDCDVVTLDWRVGLLRAIRPRIIYPRRSTPQKIVIADAATEAMIMAAIVFDKATFDPNHHALVCRGVRAAPVWEELFVVANLIYGLELTAAVLAKSGPLIPHGGQCVTYYLGNNNSLEALVRADSQRDAISSIARIFWEICAVRRITPWLERVPSNRNITDNPTRGAPVPFIIDDIADFPPNWNYFGRLISD